MAAALSCLAASAQAQDYAPRSIKPPAGKSFVNGKGEAMQCKHWRETGSNIRKSGCATEQEWKEASY